ncbi:uncharacterized protein [Pyrus communis]|uniref:uncharacterized protein n=1 Tax=Pyrus communis TaxID=23211 RepID=UPI0035BFEA25
MRKTKVNNQNMFMKIITVPIRALSKAKNCYISSITDVGGRLTYGGTPGGFSGNRGRGLPKSYSVKTTSSRSREDDDYSELIRAASARNYEERMDVNMIMQEHMKRSATTTTMRSVMGSKIGSNNRAVLPKCTVAMGRIDEDAPEDFDEGAAGVEGELYPRSRSYAVRKKSAFAF